MGPIKIGVKLVIIKTKFYCMYMV